MFRTNDPAGFRSALDGVMIKTLVYGKNTLMAQYRLDAGSQLPGHRHPHEQTGFLVSGRIRLTIGERTFEAAPGDSWCIPGDVYHAAEIIEDATAVEVFSPVREDFLPGDTAPATK